MTDRFIRIRHSTARLVHEISHPELLVKGRFWQLLLYLVGRFAIIPLRIVLQIFEAPVHLRHSSMEGFQVVSLRDPNGRFLESYTGYLRRVRTTIATVVLGTVTVAVYFFALGYQLYLAAQPTRVDAYSASIDINPTWDSSAWQDHLWSETNPCTIVDTTYLTNGSSEPSLLYGRQQNNPSDCDLTSDYHTADYVAGLKFSLASIPDNATITGVDLVTYVNTTSAQELFIGRATTDSIDTESQFDASFYSAISGAATYTSVFWNTTGAKTIGLGGTAIANVQARITGTDILPIALWMTTTTSDTGSIASVNNGTPANRPVLRVSYTLPPQTPTAFTATTQTSSSISWSWTDNATADTRYDVHDTGHSPVTGCTNLAANSTSCTETGLSANTSYTRHAYVTDPNGSTDSATDTHTTAQNTPTGISPITSFSTSLKVTATGTLPNISTGSSGLYFEETTTNQNSGWLQVNEWTLTGLDPNTEYTFRVKARNQDGVETAFSPTGANLTAAASPDVSADRSYATWYNNPNIVFTNLRPWGTGGVEAYKYAFTNSATYTHTGTEPTWSNGTLAQSANTDGATWYLHVAAYDLNLDVPSGGEASYGPFRYDGTAPTLPDAVIDGNVSDIDTQTETTSFTGAWSAASDATSGIEHYEYAIGSTAGGNDIKNWTSTGTNTSATASGLTLVPDSTYYLSVRAYDAAGNISTVRMSDGVTIDGGTEPVTTTISNVSVITTSSSATISWSTNEAATGQVEYGLTASYGTTTSHTGTATSHSVSLSNLTSNTTYHYRLTSVGTTTAVTSDATFTTEPTEEPPPPPPTARTKRPRLNPPEITSPTAGTMTITGVAHGGQSVVFRLDGRIVGRVVISGASTTKKTFSLTVKVGRLSVGMHRLTARARDSQGAISSIVTQRFAVYDAESAPSKYIGTYVVQSGDSLWSIAQQFLGDGANYNVLMYANADAHPELLTNPSLIQPGWVITIPPG